MLKQSLVKLYQEVSSLRSGLISLLGEDPEGKYRPEFAAKVFAAARQRPTKRFSSKKRFLVSLRG